MKEPYLFEEIKVKRRIYNPNYGDKRTCQCGHNVDMTTLVISKQGIN